MKINTFLFCLSFIFASNICLSQEITMFQGFWSTNYYQDDTKISKGQVKSLMTNDTEAQQLWNKSNSHLTISYIALGAEIGFLIWQLNKSKNNESQTIPLIGVLGTAAIAIGFQISANNLKKKAILI